MKIYERVPHPNLAFLCEVRMGIFLRSILGDNLKESVALQWFSFSRAVNATHRAFSRGRTSYQGRTS